MKANAKDDKDVGLSVSKIERPNHAKMTSHASDFVNAENHAREKLKVRDEDLITYPADRVSFNLPT